MSVVPPHNFTDMIKAIATDVILGYETTPSENRLIYLKYNVRRMFLCADHKLLEDTLPIYGIKFIHGAWEYKGKLIYLYASRETETRPRYL